MFKTCVALLLIAGGFPRWASADRIILRNLDVVSDRRVVDFDQDGVRLDDGSHIGWEHIERAEVSPDWQAAFDRMVGDLGTPLYRLRQRLAVGDYRGLLEPASTLYPRYVGRDSPAAYLVFQSLMWGRLAAGQREAAVEPYLRCFEYLRGRSPSEVDLPGDRRLDFDRQTGMCRELPPVWYDAAAARRALPTVLEVIGQLREPRPDGLRIYYSSLALTAGDRESARRILAGMQREQRESGELLTIAVAQSEVLAGEPGPAIERLAASLTALAPDHRPLALYWLGRAKLAAPERPAQQEGLLHLLQLPALYGTRHPDLAAAALHHALVDYARIGDQRARAALRRELLDHYGQTYHAALAREEKD
jgi:hypothetical protein